MPLSTTESQAVKFCVVVTDWLIVRFVIFVLSQPLAAPAGKRSVTTWEL